MISKDDIRIQIATIRDNYNNLERYKGNDKWHDFTTTETRSEVLGTLTSLNINPCQLILNAGAGDNDLGLHPFTIINLDISENRIKEMRFPIAANIEMIPFMDASIDVIVCIGSVINYCDAALVISEFSRILRPNGYLLIDFDSSDSGEFFVHQAFKRSAAIVETFYAGEQEVLWLYSPQFLYNLLIAAQFRLMRRVPIHILSPWAMLMLRNIRLAAILARFDRLVRHVSFLSKFASNWLFVCQKHT